MTGRMYVNAPVSSNMMTTTVTVNRVTPLHGQPSRMAESASLSEAKAEGAAAAARCTPRRRRTALDIPQTSSRSQKGISPRRDARRVVRADGKPGRVRELADTSARVADVTASSLSIHALGVPARCRSPTNEMWKEDIRVQRLHEDADHPPKHGADRHGWHKDAAGHLGAIRDDDQGGADDDCKE